MELTGRLKNEGSNNNKWLLVTKKPDQMAAVKTHHLTPQLDKVTNSLLLLIQMLLVYKGKLGSVLTVKFRQRDETQGPQMLNRFEHTSAFPAFVLLELTVRSYNRIIRFGLGNHIA